MAVPDYNSGSGMEYSSVPLLMADLRHDDDIILYSGQKENAANGLA
jgi:hypothetical protein